MLMSRSGFWLCPENYRDLAASLDLRDPISSLTMGDSHYSNCNTAFPFPLFNKPNPNQQTKNAAISSIVVEDASSKDPQTFLVTIKKSPHMPAPNGIIEHRTAVLTSL